VDLTFVVIYVIGQASVKMPTDLVSRVVVRPRKFVAIHARNLAMPLQLAMKISLVRTRCL
jgi:hypothetical protein